MIINKNNVFKNSYIQELTKKKALNRIYYKKLLIRSNLLNSTKLKILDNFQTFSIADFSKNCLTTNLGYSCNSTTFTYSNALNNLLKFKQDLPQFIGGKFNYLSLFTNTVKDLINNKTLFTNVLILNSVKGGYKCYCLGLFGFMPKRHFKACRNKALKNFFVNFKKKKISYLSGKALMCKKQKSNLTLSFIAINFFFNSFYKNNKFILRFSFYLGDTSFFTELKKVKFSKDKNFEKPLRYSRLNFIFLSETPFTSLP